MIGNDALGMFPTHRDLAWEELLEWLHRSELTFKAEAFDKVQGQFLGGTELSVLGMPSHRAEAKTRAELKWLRDNAAKSPTAIGQKDRWQAIWRELRNPEGAVRQLDIARIPADAIALYRAFHFEPIDQWGIYIVLPRLLAYCSQLERSLGSLKALERSVLTSLVLFDVFHHEFFHHLVECTATTIEILWPAPNRTPEPTYLQYRGQSWQAVLGTHQHDPLEEALANAYAYNSFSFMSRVQGGYLSGASKLYQKALEKSWKHEPPGYCEAGSYIKGGRLEGAKLLVARMLSTFGECQDLPIRMLIEAVFPSGHTAFWAKPDIPTYLVGTDTELRRFLELVPAPNATYSTLFWPVDTGPLDAFIKTERQREREAKKKALKS
jgi:hypothetical protein